MSFSFEKAIELIGLAKDNGRLAHAYLITGPVGSGKEKLAVEMIRMVNAGIDSQATKLEDLESSTIAVIGPKSKSRVVKVDEIRALEHIVHMSAPDGATKFAVIKDADRMNEQAANAFLKTLEEPPNRSRVLLLSSRPEMLLETILSRCINIPLAGGIRPEHLSESACALLDSLKNHAESGKGGISGALGLMSQFAAILKEEKSVIAKRNDDALKAESAHYRQRMEGDYLKRREEYYKALTEAEYLEKRNRLIDYLMMWFGDAMRQQNGGANLDLPEYAEATRDLAAHFTVDELGQRIEAVEKLRTNLSTNVFEALALEVGFIRAFA
ncbi:MAG: hypothetical protein P1U58_01860 [Verrucomicrobiales bacterium]|nr:hypothetical protein [Verrucomicrobiales bacterium]